MNAADRTMLHGELLGALREKGDGGLPERYLYNFAQMAGHQLTLPELQSELRALGNKNWIAPFAAELAPGRWRITALGESKLVEAGL